MIQNKRDLGGLKTVDGRRIRPGCLVRSAHLYQAAEEDISGIATVIDLRAAWEAMGDNYISGKLQMDPDLVARFKAAVLE